MIIPALSGVRYRHPFAFVGNTSQTTTAHPRSAGVMLPPFTDWEKFFFDTSAGFAPIGVDLNTIGINDAPRKDGLSTRLFSPQFMWAGKMDGSTFAMQDLSVVVSGFDPVGGIDFNGAYQIAPYYWTPSLFYHDGGSVWWIGTNDAGHEIGYVSGYAAASQRGIASIYICGGDDGFGNRWYIDQLIARWATVDTSEVYDLTRNRASFKNNYGAGDDVAGDVAFAPTDGVFFTSAFFPASIPETIP